MQIRQPLRISKFAFADELEKVMKETFNINEDKDVRLWNKYLSNTFEPLNKKSETLQDAGLFEGQVSRNGITILVVTVVSSSVLLFFFIVLR